MAGLLYDLNRAVLISNTRSGANRRHGIDGVHRRASSAGLQHFRIDDIHALEDILPDCARRGIGLIILNAGDGTVCRLLDVIRDGAGQEPVLALLRGGTTNMIHKDVGWRGRPEAALGDLLSHLRDGRGVCRERHVLQVERSCPDAVYRGFFFGTHALVRAIQGARARFHARVSTGVLSESLVALLMLWRLLRRRVERDPVLAPVSVAMARNGGSWEQAMHILLMATTLKRMILGVRPLASGQHAGLAALTWPDYRLGPWLGRLARGRLEPLQVLSLRGEFDWILDGEIRHHRTTDGALTVSLGEPAHFLTRGDGP